MPHFIAAGHFQPRQPEPDLPGTDGKSQAGVAAEAKPSADLTVDSNHLASHGNQRPTRITRIEFGVGHDAFGVGALGVVQCRNDPDGEGRRLVEHAQREGIAYRHHLVSDP